MGILVKYKEDLVSKIRHKLFKLKCKQVNKRVKHTLSRSGAYGLVSGSFCKQTVTKFWNSVDLNSYIL